MRLTTVGFLWFREWDIGLTAGQKHSKFCRSDSENAARKNGSGDGGGGGFGVASQSEAACCIRASVQVCRGMFSQCVLSAGIECVVAGCL